MNGKIIYKLAKKLWPINRSLTGQGNRKTLKILKEVVPLLKIQSVKCGSKAFDWKIPPEWNVKQAFIENTKKQKVINFKDNNLHLVGYSKKIRKKLNFNELKKKLYYLKEFPSYIPYITSYYKRDWGFCVSYNQFKKLKKEKIYKVNIDTTFNMNGNLNYGEIYLPGKSNKEIFFSTYICHPSMANNELSGPCVAIYLAKWINTLKRNYSYRFVFLPETIGSIYYLSQNIDRLKKNVIAGFNLTCVGDDREYSFLPSKYKNSLSDKISLKVLKKKIKKFKVYTWLERGSDERQYCSPKVDLPIVSLMRSKYHTYKEYHTSGDDLKSVVTSKGLGGSFNLYKEVVKECENNLYPKTKIICEPNLSKRNLYPFLNHNNKKEKKFSKDLLNFLSYSDGSNSLLDISKKIKTSYNRARNIYKILIKNKIIF